MSTLLAVYNWTPKRGERYVRSCPNFMRGFFAALPALRQQGTGSFWRQVDVNAKIAGWTRHPAAEPASALGKAQARRIGHRRAARMRCCRLCLRLPRWRRLRASRKCTRWRSGRAPLADEQLSDGGLITALVHTSLASAQPDGSAADIELRWAKGALPPIRLLLSDAATCSVLALGGRRLRAPERSRAGFGPAVRQRALLGSDPAGGCWVVHAVRQHFQVREGREHLRPHDLHSARSGCFRPQRRRPQLAVGEAGGDGAPADASRLRRARCRSSRRMRSSPTISRAGTCSSAWDWRNISRWRNAPWARAAFTRSRSRRTPQALELIQSRQPWAQAAEADRRLWRDRSQASDAPLGHQVRPRRERRPARRHRPRALYRRAHSAATVRDRRSGW